MKPVLLFTDHFPYGNQEAYLHDEMSVLPKVCDQVLFVPFKEFAYAQSNLRSIDADNVHILRVNAPGTPWGVGDRLFALRYALAAIAEEVFLGKHKGFHLRNFKRAVTECMHAAYQAKTLAADLAERGIENPVIYNYWVSTGVLISDILIRRHGVKSIVQSRVHAIDLYNDTYNLMLTGSATPKLLFNRFRLRKIERLYPISQHGANYLEAKYPFVASKLTIHRLGVLNPGKIEASPNHESTKVLVSCSTLTAVKRLHLFPELVKRLKTAVRWVHLGGGSEAETLSLQRAIDEAGVSDRCALLGQMQHHEVIRYYREHHIDLFMNLSVIESTPVSLMEAASFGIPMLATRVMGSPEIVDNTNGILVNPHDDLDAIAAEIDAFLNDDNRHAQARLAARKCFEDKYDAVKNYQAFTRDLLR